MYMRVSELLLGSHASRASERPRRWREPGAPAMRLIQY
jgi:hypothetical protein